MKIGKDKDLMTRYDFGGFKVSIYFNAKKLSRCRVCVESASKAYAVTVTAPDPAYMYVLESERAGDAGSIEAWVMTNYIVSSQIGFNKEFAMDIIASVAKWQNELSETAKKQADAVSASDEAEDEAFMRDVIEYAGMDDAQRSERKEVMREEFRKLVDEMDAADADLERRSDD